MSRNVKYKPSGIDWIGDLPKDWKTLRIKNVASIVTGSTPSSSVVEYWDGDIIWVTPGDFNKYDKIIDDSDNKITEAGYNSCGASIVPVGSVVITTRAPIGNVLISGKELCTNQGCKTLVPFRIESRFLYYIISISSIELNILGQGTTFLELSKESLGTFKLPLPEFYEQKEIAYYLDDKTQKIDRLIANKKAQVEKLKKLRQIEINNAVTKGLNPNVEMKDSGVDYLGKIPKHWEVKRLKNVADINATKQELIYDRVKSLEVVFLAMESVSENGQIDNSEKRPVSELWEGFTYFKRNDVIIAKITPCFENGKGAWLNNLESNFGFGSTEFHTVSGHINKLDNHFFYQVTKSDVFMKIGEAFMTGSAGQKRVSTYFILTYKLALPPINEQIEIANYIHLRTSAIDKLIKNIEAQIEKLQELRKIKIYEAVTGKIKVSAYATTTA